MSRLIGIAAALMLGAALVVAPAAFAQLNVFGLTGPSTPPALAGKLDHPVSAQLMDTLAKASHEGLEFTGKPAADDLVAISGPRPNKGHKVGLLYIGADFCPFCASERWGLMLALLRFGKLGGMRYMLSSPTDVYANTPTVTFQHAHYQSRYVALQAMEIADREEHPLMTLDALQTKIITRFDVPPYVRFRQSIPFVYLDGRYLLGQLLIAPGNLANQDWQQVADALANPESDLFKDAMPRVNLLTAAICHLDGDKPADVCTARGVVAARSVLAGLRTRAPQAGSPHDEARGAGR